MLLSWNACISDSKYCSDYQWSMISCKYHQNLVSPLLLPNWESWQGIMVRLILIVSIVGFYIISKHYILVMCLRFCHHHLFSLRVSRTARQTFFLSASNHRESWIPRWFWGNQSPCLSSYCCLVSRRSSIICGSWTQKR